VTPAAGVNPPPPQAALATFILREVVALCFVLAWMALFAVSLFTEEFEVPFWLHMVGVGVLAYALGINVADLTAFRPASKADAAVAIGQAVVNRKGED
jgi:hypothetical protein